MKIKIFIVLCIFFTELNCTDAGQFRLLIEFKNNTKYLINVIVKRVDFQEYTYTIKMEESETISTIGNEKEKNERPSSKIEYIKIKNSLDEEIMSLQGDSLDNALKYVDESKWGIHYKLDIN